MWHEKSRCLDEMGHSTTSSCLGATCGHWTCLDQVPFEIIIYDVLPTPTNLHKCGLTEECYRWRHDKALVEIARSCRCLEEGRKPQKQQLQFINFVKPGGTAAGSHQAYRVLYTASDWEVVVDLNSQHRFPGKINETSLWPDIVIWSHKTKQVAIVELTERI